MALSEFPDLGSLQEDLLAYLVTTRRTLRHPLIRRILPDLFAERMRSDDLAPLLERVSSSRRRVGVAILDRAVERGDLRADVDKELAMDFIPAPLYWRTIVLGKRVGMNTLRKQAVALVAALKAC